jgi:hypothetical protein
VGYLCAIIHITRFPRESNFLASCSSRRHWRAEARRARVASRGAAEALCWARRSRLHARLQRKHQPHLMSETDAGVHVKATRGRERRTRLGVLSGFRNFYCCLSVCLSVCVRAVDSSFHIYHSSGKIPIKRTYPLVSTPLGEKCWFWRFKKMIIVINCRYKRSVLTPNSSRPVKISPEAEGVMDAGFPGLRGSGVHCGNAQKCSKQRPREI